MKNTVSEKAESYGKERRWKKGWRRAVTGMAAVVVFCTTYALILPAITMEKYVCGMEEHQHTAACYTQGPAQLVSALECDFEPHRHTQECMNEDGEPVCGYADFVVHTHDRYCRDGDGKLICGLPEIKGRVRLASSSDAEPYVEVDGKAYELHTHEAGCFENGRWVCGKLEVRMHQHTEECFGMKKIPVATGSNYEDYRWIRTASDSNAAYVWDEDEEDWVEAFTASGSNWIFPTASGSNWDEEPIICDLTEEDGHVHTQECFDGWVLICDKEEHTHTEDCLERNPLTPEEQAEVDAVIALIDALPEQAEIEQAFAALDTAGDEKGYEAYILRIYEQATAAHSRYVVLSEPQKEHVTNVEKLMSLEWLWSVTHLDSPSRVEPMLDGDYAYLTDVQMKVDAETESGYAVRTGTAPWDGDSEAGNDQNALNNVLRTFDTATYTIQFNTNLRKEVSDQNIAGYEKGRIYFEFILPASAVQAQFEVGSMGWLESSQEIQYEIAEIEDGTKQVLRGSYLLVPNTSNPAAIGASTNELSVAIRALQMQNGTTLQPTFTLWLDYNDVGTEYADGIPQSIVTGTDYSCQAKDGENVHGQEFRTVEGPEITISAAPRYNIALVAGDNSRTTTVGTYNFNETTNTDAPNYGLGSRYGRLNGFGIRIEILGKSGQGMRGIELPDTEKTIEFDLTLSAKYQGRSDRAENYQPLFWSGGGNKSDSSGTGNPDGRKVNTPSKCIPQVPYNIYNNAYDSCRNGGAWSFTQSESGGNTVHVTVSGFVVDTTQFPYSNPSSGSLSKSYYNPDRIKNYWEIDQAVFSCGEVWVLQPYYDADGNYIAEKYGEGQFNTSISDSNLEIYGVSGTKLEKQARETDDTINVSRYLKNPGSIDARMCYVKYKTRTWNNALTEGGYDTDEDWAAAGNGVTLETWISHDGSEGEYQGVAYDMLMKFDDEFFEPDGDSSRSLPGSGNMTAAGFWAAKKDGTGWNDDEEMKEATEDELVFYSSLKDLKAAEAVPVGYLVEMRGISSTPSGMNHHHTFIDGKIKADCPSDNNNVYLFTRATYAWSKKDVAEAAARYRGKTVEELTDDDYNQYIKNEFPSVKNGKGTAVKLESGNEENFAEGYLKPFWRQDYYYCQGRGEISSGSVNSNTEMLRKCEKASYDANGYHPGVGLGYYQDSCLVVPYETTITKVTAQHEKSSETSKRVYDMGQNQRTADFLLSPRIERTNGVGVSTAGEMSTTVYVKDTLPEGLTYIQGTSYIGGNYEQDPLHQNPGKVEGGVQQEPEISTDSAGHTTLTWKLAVTMNANDTVWTDPIYFSCTIGKAGDEEHDVKNQQQIDNQVIVWTEGRENQIKYDEAFGTRAVYGIEVLKTDAVSLSKLADQLVVDWWSPMGFAMNVGNNSANAKQNTVIVETLPYNNLDGTSFHGSLKVTEFSAGTMESEEDSDKLLDGFEFYYTMDESFAGCRSSEFMTDGACSYDFKANSGTWKKLTRSSSHNTAESGHPYGIFENFPDVEEQNSQITAIVAVGNLPANETLKMHITLELENGKEEDYLVNYLSQDSLTSYARTQVVNRSLEGLAWWDVDADGIQDSGEEKLSGVKVSLWKLNDKGEYEQCCYDGTTTPIVILTGHEVSVRAEGAAGVAEYKPDGEEGHYKFTDLAAGTYAVRFEDGTAESGITISSHIATAKNQGADDTKDSDADGYYSSDKSVLQYTQISGIDMPEAQALTYGIYESKHNDSGFYERGVELPNAGGPGREWYTIAGLLLIASSAILLMYKKAREEEKCC